jgi:hypothetical protein
VSEYGRPDWKSPDEVPGALPRCLAAGRLSSDGGRRFGGCVRVHERWILTAHHVIDIPDLALRFKATFNNIAEDGSSVPFEYRLDPDQGFFPSADGIQGISGEKFDLDYLFVALAGPYPAADPSLANVARIDVRPPAVGDRAHILQSSQANKVLRFAEDHLSLYPEAGRVRHVDADYAYYQVSTRKGTSGSPVFDEDWNLRALHRSSYRAEFATQWAREYNFGSLMSRIVADVRVVHPGFPVDQVLTFVEAPE